MELRLMNFTGLTQKGDSPSLTVSSLLLLPYPWEDLNPHEIETWVYAPNNS
jgi:hypothetical protein